MKTFYELEKAERDKYLQEFKKTPVGKDMNILLGLYHVLTVVFFVLWGYLEGFSNELKQDQEFSWLINAIGVFTALSFFISILYQFYLNFNFTAWLKNKYDIKRW